jgi:Cu+-exporting ATPase
MKDKEKKKEQKEVKLRIKGMTCTSCASSIGTNLKKMDGVNFAGVNIVDKTALVKYDPKKVNVENIKKTVEKTGYEAYDMHPDMSQMPPEVRVKTDAAIDPVCGMTVDRKTAISKVILGKPYYFCMQKCADDFEKAANELGLEGAEHKFQPSKGHMMHEDKEDVTALDPMSQKVILDPHILDKKNESEGTAIDPVCHMTVDKKTAISKVILGKPYYFCMQKCADDFEAAANELGLEGAEKKYAISTQMMASPKEDEGDTAIDPICGMTCDKKSAIKEEIGGKTYYFCMQQCADTFRKQVEEEGLKSIEGKAKAVIKGMPKEADVEEKYIAIDPICGMKVDKRKAITRVIGGRTYYFCMESCANTFEDPEKELADMKKRVSVAITGVILLGIFRLGLFIGLAAGVTIIEWVPFDFLPWFNGAVWMLILTTPIIFIGGKSFFVGAAKALKHRRANMDLLITIGTLTAYLYSTVIVIDQFVTYDILPGTETEVYFDTAVVIIAFILLGKYMEDVVRKKSSAAVKNLMDLKPKMATLVINEQEVEVPVEKLKIGDIVLVKPGDAVPTDGVVIHGASSIDEKMLTGESIPVEKKSGDEVIGGTINKLGSFKFRVTKVGKETMLMQIVKMVEEAQVSSAPIQRYADRVAAYFVPAVIMAGIITFIAWIIVGTWANAVLFFVAVLIISCPCALGIATPTALMVGVGKGAEGGILIRGGEYLEDARNLEVVVFDKTGTLTKGEPELTDVIVTDSLSENEALGYAAAAEKGSEHPLGEAIVKGARKRGLEIPDTTHFEAVPGHGIKVTLNEKEILLGNRRLMRNNEIETKGIETTMKKLEGEGKTAMILAVDGKISAVVAVADTIKENSARAIKEIKKIGIETVMLTGDNEITAKAVAKKVGIERVIANVLPGDKAKVIKDIQTEGKVVAMVGDGINDAPALAQADIGIALGSGSDVAKETGGIVLIKDDLMDVVKAVRLSKLTMRKIKQNLFWALGYNTGAIPIAALGFLNPIIAAAAMSASSLSVVTNAATLKFAKLT